MVNSMRLSKSAQLTSSQLWTGRNGSLSDLTDGSGAWTVAIAIPPQQGLPRGRECYQHSPAALVSTGDSLLTCPYCGDFATLCQDANEVGWPLFFRFPCILTCDQRTRGE